MAQSVRWGVFEDISNLTFVGKDVISVHNSMHIMFLNVITLNESIYIAKDEQSGDGIECYAGHRTSTIFVFAEKSNKARLFLLTYPEFKIMAILTDEEINKFIAVGLTEGEQIVAMSGYPNYITSIWCWRTKRKLISCETGIRSPEQIFRCSMTHSLFCHNWKSKLCVWEIIPCYKMFMLLPRRHSGYLPTIIDIVWTNEGNLYCIDKDANLYSIASDGIGMITSKEWSTAKGSYTPIIAFYKGGLVIYGPQNLIQHLKKVHKGWLVDWKYTPPVPIMKMVSGGLGDTLLLVTDDGDVLKLSYENDKITSTIVAFWQRSIKLSGIVYPLGDEIVTIDSENVVCLWTASEGNVISRIKLNENVTCMASCLIAPYIAICGSANDKYGVCVVNADKTLKYMSSKSLTHQIINQVIWVENGEQIIAFCKLIGGIFILKITNHSSIDMLHFIDIDTIMIDCKTTVLDEESYFIALIQSTKGQKKLVLYKISTGTEVLSFSEINESIKTIAFVGYDVLLCVSHLPQEVNTMKLKVDKTGLITMYYVNTFPLDHHISGISIAKAPNGWISWGLDGIFTYRMPQSPYKLYFKVIARHRFGEVIDSVIIDPKLRYAITLTACSNLTVHEIKTTATKQSANIKTKVSTLRINLTKYDICDPDGETWIELMDLKKEAEEAAEWADQRREVEMEFQTIHENLLVLLEENFVAPPLHQLPIITFNLNNEAQVQKAKEAADEREKTRIKIQKCIKAQDKVTEWIKINCWDCVDVIGKEIFAIFTDESVENYALLPATNVQKNNVLLAEYFRKMEMKQDDNVFTPWEEEADPTRSLTQIDVEGQEEAPEATLEDHSKDSNIKDEGFYKMTGSTAYLYINLLPYAYHQMQVQSNLQIKWQTIMTEQTTNMLKVWFNKQFDDMMAVKAKELSTVEERNARLRVIISELNKLAELRGSTEVIDITIKDPQWAQQEIPSKLIDVQEDEVDVTPYISPSQIVLELPDLGPKDNFYELALIVMMDGVLEKLWHEEIKKIVPKPLCMLTKEPEDFDTDELKEVLQYEKNVEFRNEEREKYRKMLRQEYSKLSGLLNEGIVRFNNKIRDFYLLKIKVESAIGQENLRLMRLRVESLDRIEAQEHSTNLEMEISNNESEHEGLQNELNDIQNQLTECHLAYENLTARDRALDKNFKSNFSDVSPIVQDLCYKLFK